MNQRMMGINQVSEEIYCSQTNNVGELLHTLNIIIMCNSVYEALWVVYNLWCNLVSASWDQLNCEGRRPKEDQVKWLKQDIITIPCSVTWHHMTSHDIFHLPPVPTLVAVDKGHHGLICTPPAPSPPPSPPHQHTCISTVPLVTVGTLQQVRLHPFSRGGHLSITNSILCELLLKFLYCVTSHFLGGKWGHSARCNSMNSTSLI